MKISFKGDYALKIILDLAVNYYHGIIPIKEISKRQDIPERFLEQIVTILKGAGYVKTVRGPRGGIGLAKKPVDITLGEIIRLMEGPTSPIACVSKSGYSPCEFERRCALRCVFEEVREKINTVVDTVTFQDMVDKTHQLHSTCMIEYSI
ncbi:MAG: Rrf2 family transcriptional regulator [Endomicrobiales bacterium]|jgi:Rrf2 family protein